MSCFIFCNCCKGCSVVACSAPVDGQAFAFKIKFAAGSQVPVRASALYITDQHSDTSSSQAAKEVLLAAADDESRQRCMCMIQAASTSTPSPLQDIALSVALVHDLLNMKSLPAIKAVFAALNVTLSDAFLKNVGLDPPSLRAAGYDAAAFRAAGCSAADMKAAGFTLAEYQAAGCDAVTAQSMGYDENSLMTAFGLEAMISSGCELSFVFVSCAAAILHAFTYALSNSPLPPSPSLLPRPHSPKS
jgi:hypothetical protein